MRPVLFAFFILASVIITSCSTSTVQREQERSDGTPPRAPSKLQTSIDTILDDSLLSPCFIGAKIISPDDGSVLYERNANKLFHPASNMKLLTTATALGVLGSEFKLHTDISTDGTVKNGIIRGNVYIRGVGDPLVKADHLDSIAENWSRRGCTKITGDLVGDVSYFDSLYWGLGWMWDDEPSSDAPFLTPLTVNGNAIQISATPGLTATNHEARAIGLEMVPKTNYVHLTNAGIVSSDTTIPPLDITRLRGGNDIVATGRMMPGSKVQEFDLSVWKPEFYFLELFKERLHDHGITVEGSCRLDSANGSTPLAAIVHPIDSILHQINKPSDNLGAENLLKTLAAEKYHVPGSAARGLSVVREYLASKGLDTTKMILADGSGMSWYNAISPSALVQLLLAEYKETKTFRNFYESLPVAGVDGTLKNRMKGTRAENNVHAKTGSLTGVSSLSGYVTTGDGKMLIFSILSNHFPADIVALRNAQNRIMEVLANYHGGN